MPPQLLPLAAPKCVPPPARLHVTHAVQTLECGGLERVVLDLLQMGMKRGQQVSVLCLERPGALSGQVEELGVRLVCLNKSPGLRLNTVDRARAALEELRPDVVHSHHTGALLYIGAAALKSGIRAVLHTEHGNHVKRTRNWQRRLRYRLLIGCASRYCGRICCVSSDIAKTVGTLGFLSRRKIRVVPNGIDCSAFTARSDKQQVRASLGIPDEAVVIGTVGRLHEVKRQDLLIRAFASVRGQFRSMHLVLVGEGPAREELEALCRTLDVESTVHFVGYQAEPQRFLGMMDFFALTSRTEGMPLAILEAWAAGLPVVASAVGGVCELIAPGHNGLLFPSGNLPALVAALEQLFADRDRATALGRAGQSCVQSRFSVERMAATYEDQYQELLHASSLSQHRLPAPG